MSSCCSMAGTGGPIIIGVHAERPIVSGGARSCLTSRHYPCRRRPHSRVAEREIVLQLRRRQHHADACGEGHHQGQLRLEPFDRLQQDQGRRDRHQLGVRLPAHAMWQVDNRTPFAAERGWVRDRNGAEIWLVAVKARSISGPTAAPRYRQSSLPCCASPSIMVSLARAASSTRPTSFSPRLPPT